VAPNQRAVCCSRGVASDFDICGECLCEHEINAEGQVEEAGGERVGQSVVLNLTSGETPALASISTRASAEGSASWCIHCHSISSRAAHHAQAYSSACSRLRPSSGPGRVLRTRVLDMADNRASRASSSEMMRATARATSNLSKLSI
jgi:hypothetical protein